jgi:hypothetical protein
LKVVVSEDSTETKNDPDSDDFLNEETLSRLKKEGGKVSFEEMGKIIGQRWKNIDPDRLSTYSEMAAEDTERYKNEMQTYNGRQEAKMRSEALKPPVQFQGPPGGSGVARGGPESYPQMPPGVGHPHAHPQGMDPRHGMGGYPEQMANMSAFGNPNAPGMGAPAGYNPYGGMDQFGGYGAMGMGAYGMGAYGGAYGMGGPAAQDAMRGGMEPPPPGYGAGGYGGMGMMGGGFQGGMMGYGGGAPDYGQGGQQQQQQQHPPPEQYPPHPGMYGGGYGAGQGWGGQ